MNHFDSVASRFDDQAARWRDLYDDRQDVFSVIHVARRDWALSAVAELDLADGTMVLDAGAGAGGLTTALAQAGLRVVAVDASARMLELTKHAAAERGLGDRVTTVWADATSLPFDNEAFPVVVALGLLPWVSDPDAVLKELCRVTTRGGHVIVNADNFIRLSHALDPRESRRLAPLRATVATILGRSRSTEVLPKGQTADQLRRLVAESGLELIYLRPLGFGPFTFNRRHTLPHSIGRRANRVLQWLADRDVLKLASVSNMHLVLARRSE